MFDKIKHWFEREKKPASPPLIEPTDNVVILDGVTTMDIPPDRVLNGALGKLDAIILLGWDKNGEMYVASSTTDHEMTLWLIEKFRHKLLNGDYGSE
jgi:hypothetical protein